MTGFIVYLQQGLLGQGNGEGAACLDTKGVSAEDDILELVHRLDRGDKLLDLLGSVELEAAALDGEGGGGHYANRLETIGVDACATRIELMG